MSRGGEEAHSLGQFGESERSVISGGAPRRDLPCKDLKMNEEPLGGGAGKASAEGGSGRDGHREAEAPDTGRLMSGPGVCELPAAPGGPCRTLALPRASRGGGGRRTLPGAGWARAVNEWCLQMVQSRQIWETGPWGCGWGSQRDNMGRVCSGGARPLSK